jgi:hypothetical protein
MGKGGTVILIHPDFQIKQSGTVNLGRVSWALLASKKGEFNVASVYVPNEAPERQVFWNTLQTALPQGN